MLRHLAAKGFDLTANGIYGFYIVDEIPIRGPEQAAQFPANPLRNRHLPRHLVRHCSLSDGQGRPRALDADSVRREHELEPASRQRLWGAFGGPFTSAAAKSETVNGNGREALDYAPVRIGGNGCSRSVV